MDRWNINVLDFAHVIFEDSLLYIVLYCFCIMLYDICILLLLLQILHILYYHIYDIATDILINSVCVPTNIVTVQVSQHFLGVFSQAIWV